MAKLALSVLGDDQIHLIGSKPLPVANPKSPYLQRGTPALEKRSFWSKFPEARKEFGTMRMVFGFRLPALTNLDGLFARWAFAAANQADVTWNSNEADLVRPWLARGLTEGLEDPESPSLGVDSGRQGLYQHRRADTETIEYGGSNGAWSESLDRVRTRRIRP